MVGDKPNISPMFQAALVALAMTLLMFTGATISSDQIASLESEGFKSSAEKLDLRLLKSKMSTTSEMVTGPFGVVTNDYRSKVTRPRTPTEIPKLLTEPTVVPKPATLVISVSTFKPAVVNNVAGTTSEVANLFEGINYRMDVVLASGVVPRLFVSNLPQDLLAIRQTAQRKRIFIMTALPLILHVNERILHDRARLTLFRDRHLRNLAMSADDDSWLTAMADRYGVEKANFDALLEGMDIIPPSLALAQSAVESGWGTSRFAREGNALFGQRTWRDKPGLVPLERAKGAKHRVRSFSHLLDGVKSYAHNLNSHAAYKEFRRLRAKLRKQGKALDGVQLAGTLHRYSERGAKYVKTIRTILRVNQLSMLDSVRLG